MEFMTLVALHGLPAALCLEVRTHVQELRLIVNVCQIIMAVSTFGVERPGQVCSKPVGVDTGISVNMGRGVVVTVRTLLVGASRLIVSGSGRQTLVGCSYAINDREWCRMTGFTGNPSGYPCRCTLLVTGGGTVGGRRRLYCAVDMLCRVIVTGIT